MISKIVIASVLAASSVSGSAQEAKRVADGSTSQSPRMHRCTLAAVSNFTVHNMGDMSSSRMSGESASWSRSDLHLAGLPGGAGPTITAHAINTKGTGMTSGRASNDFAINTKGTGQSSGRMSAAPRNQNPIGIDCVTSQLSGDAAAQKATVAGFAFMSADGTGVGWSCSVSGSADKPMFRIDLLVPTILGQAERQDYSMSGHGRGVSIVARGAASSDSWHVACASKDPLIHTYDLAVLKKA